MKKIGLLCLALVLALGALGVGYAAWTDVITINGSVSTGSACVKFISPLESNDPCPADGTHLDYTADPCFATGVYLPQYPKDVGCTDVEAISDDTAQVTLYNTYPCYAVEVTLHEQNCGTVPLIAKKVVLTYLDESGAEVKITVRDGSCYYIPGITQYDDTWGNVIEFQWVNNTGTQREPGGNWEDSFFIHVLQPAKQGTSYTFTITREYIQWDEYVPGT